jgi:hypothetical protein
LLVVEKNGDIKETEIKRDMITPDELAKKCKFKKYDGFCKRTEWGYNIQNFKIFVEMWAKIDGIANQENKYEFPPPLDHDLYFGACVLIAHDAKNNYVDLTESLWDKIYEHLFGGFESLVSTRDDDDDEEDELDNIPDSKKTKHGYLKDGFVVDGGVNSDEDDEDDDDDDDEDDDDDDDDDDNDDDDDGHDDDDDVQEESDDDNEDKDDESDGNNSDDSDGNKVKKVKKNNKKMNVSNNKHANTIVKTNINTKIKQEQSIPSSLNSKKVDNGMSSTSRKRNTGTSLVSNSKIKRGGGSGNGNGNGNYNSKNTKISKIEEEQNDDCKSYDSSELSEEEYTYKI